MGAVTTLPGALDALRTALAALDGLAGVNVYTAPVEAEALGKECVVLCTEATTSEYEYPTAGMLQAFERYDVDGFIWTSKPGGGETAIKAARDRAYAILEAVHDYLASLTTTAATISALTVDDARITSATLEQFAADGARQVFLKFRIVLRARFTPA